MNPTPISQPSSPSPHRLPEKSRSQTFLAVKSWLRSAFALLCLFDLGASTLQAQMITVNPVEAPGALTNPLMGFRGGSGPYVTVVQQYIPWSAIENQESDSVQKIRDYCNAHWANHPANNVRVIPRVYVDWDEKSGQRELAVGFDPGRLD